MRCVFITTNIFYSGLFWSLWRNKATINRSENLRLQQNSIPGVNYGHTGHVRFLTIVENPAAQKQPKPSQTSLKSKTLSRRSTNAEKLQKQAETTQNNKETLIISGGDGYEDFRSSTMTEDAGREDSTNHLLLWRVWTNHLRPNRVQRLHFLRLEKR